MAFGVPPSGGSRIDSTHERALHRHVTLQRSTLQRPPMTKYHSLLAVRVRALLFPPAGLPLLWRSSQIGLGRKIFGTLGIILYVLPYSALAVVLLHRFCGLEYEFRGGVVPRLTFHKTVPDYDALDASRAKQKQAASLAMTTPAP